MQHTPSQRRARRATASVNTTPTGRDFTHLALWMAATLAGVVTVALLAQGPVFRALARRAGWAGRSAAAFARGGRRASGRRGRKHRPTPEQSLPMLADAVVGNSKCAVASVFGPPHGAIMTGAVNQYSNYWQADTWYYPLPKNGPLAMVIQFDEDFAAGVEFVKPPGRG